MEDNLCAVSLEAIGAAAPCLHNFINFYSVLNKVLPCLRLVYAVLDLNQQLLHLFLWNVVDFKQFILYKLGFRIIK